MKNEVKIRECKKEDIPHIYALWEKLVENERERNVYYEKDEWPTINDIKKHFSNCFNSEDNFWIFVADYKNKILGYSELWFCNMDDFSLLKNYAYINNIFIDKSIKVNVNPLNLFFKLIQACENKAKEKKCDYIGGNVFEFNTQMKTLLKLYKIRPYRTCYVKRLKSDG